MNVDFLIANKGIHYLSFLEKRNRYGRVSTDILVSVLLTLPALRSDLPTLRVPLAYDIRALNIRMDGFSNALNSLTICIEGSSGLVPSL